MERLWEETNPPSCSRQGQLQSRLLRSVQDWDDWFWCSATFVTTFSTQAEFPVFKLVIFTTCHYMGNLWLCAAWILEDSNEFPSSFSLNLLLPMLCKPSSFSLNVHQELQSPWHFCGPPLVFLHFVDLSFGLGGTQSGHSISDVF